jgi:glycosyltransferase involved in cell wall biosynthesis
MTPAAPLRLGFLLGNDPWRFIQPIFDDFRARPEYTVSVFAPRTFTLPMFNTRVNNYLFRHDLESFLRGQDVAFFEWASDLLVAASHLPKRVPIIVRLHRYELYQFADQVNWENVDRIILVSEAKRRQFIARFPQAAARTLVIPEHVDTVKFQPFQKPYGGDLGTLAFLSPRKRIYELILAYATLEAQQPGFRLHLGGAAIKHSDYGEALQRLVGQLGLRQKVIFYGDVADAREWLPNIDVFISHSYDEGLQVAPIEAMATGRYTLSHFWDGADELVPAAQLYLTDPELHSLILNHAVLPQAEKDALSAAARDRVERCLSLSGVQETLRALVQEVAQS